MVVWSRGLTGYYALVLADLPVMYGTRGWQAFAACIGADPETFFPDRPATSADMDRARVVCRSCPVLERCRDYVDELEEGIPRSYLFGIFAAETPSERWRRRRANGAPANALVVRLHDPLKSSTG